MNFTQNGPALLALSNVRYLWHKGDALVKSIEFLVKQQESEYHEAISLLAAIAVESLLKSYIAAELCYDMRHESQERIDKQLLNYLKKLGHNLEGIFHKHKNIFKELNIINVEKVAHKKILVCEYKFTLKNNTVLYFKDIESIRYGALANCRDYGLFKSSQFDEMITFLNNLSSVTLDKINYIARLLKGVAQKSTAQHKKAFKEKVLEVVRGIPEGETMTYKEVAAAAGSPKAYRAVGNILNKNYDPSVPCHRVVRSDGALGGYNRGAEEKKKLLKKERAI